MPLPAVPIAAAAVLASMSIGCPKSALPSGASDRCAELSVVLREVPTGIAVRFVRDSGREGLSSDDEACLAASGVNEQTLRVLRILAPTSPGAALPGGLPAPRDGTYRCDELQALVSDDVPYIVIAALMLRAQQPMHPEMWNCFDSDAVRRELVAAGAEIGVSWAQ